MGLTHAWAQRSKDHFELHKDRVPWFEELGGATQSLFGIVQGGMYADLRMPESGGAAGGRWSRGGGDWRAGCRRAARGDEGDGIVRTLEWLLKDKLLRYVMGGRVSLMRQD